MSLVFADLASSISGCDHALDFSGHDPRGIHLPPLIEWEAMMEEFSSDRLSRQGSFAVVDPKLCMEDPVSYTHLTLPTILLV